MNIQWKRQHINNACVPACVAMLLSPHNINKEDFEIIFESKRPYLIKFNKSQNAFNAGVLVQFPEIVNIVANKYNFEVINNDFENFCDYFKYAKNLIKKDIAFFTSVAQGYIPSVGYKQNKNKRGHAVIVYKIENDRFYFLDPDGGINRKEKNDFEKVIDFVSYSIHKNEVKKILEVRNKFIIGNLKKQSKFESNICICLNESKQVLKKYSEIFREQVFSIINNNNKIGYNDFYDFIVRIIKPIALDLKNALLTIPNPSNQESNLISQLDELFNSTLKIQKLLKENPDYNIENQLDDILKKNDQIQETALIVVNDEIQRCH